MVLSPAIILFLLYEAFVKIGAATEAAKANTILQWVIILLIFLPISIGFLFSENMQLKMSMTNFPKRM